MLHAIAILGGSLLMMGQHSRSASLFYYFRIEDQVRENHLLRVIDRQVSFDFVREKLRAFYSETGRPSIDPEVLLRILLLGNGCAFEVAGAGGGNQLGHTFKLLNLQTKMVLKD
jgi:hypothetical protein